MLGVCRRFCRDQGGAFGYVLSIAAVPVMGLVGIALDHGRQASSGVEVNTVLNEACSRTRSAYFAPRPVQERLAAAEQVIAMRTEDIAAMENVTFSADVVADEIVVAASGMVGAQMSAVMGAGAYPVDIALRCGEKSARQPATVCMVLLDRNEKKSLHVHEALVDAPGCGVHVASVDDDAAVVHHDSTFLLGRICVAGQLRDGALLDFSKPQDEWTNVLPSAIGGLIQENCAHANPPLPSVSIAYLAGCPGGVGTTTITSDTQIPPGAICGNYIVTNGATLTLSPGVHYFDRGTLSVEDGASLIGEGSTIVLGSRANIETHDAYVRITAPTATGFAGIAFYDEAGGSIEESRITDEASWEIDGAVHLPGQNFTIDDEAHVRSAPGGHMRWVSNKLEVRDAEMTITVTPTTSLVPEAF